MSVENENLKSLYTALLDAKAGYAEASLDVKDPTVGVLLKRMLTLHSLAADEVRDMFPTPSEKTESGPSFMATLNKLVVGARSAITGLNPLSLSAFVDGEHRLGKRYEAVLDDTAIPDEIKGKIEAQYRAVQDVTDQMSAVSGRSRQTNAG